MLASRLPRGRQDPRVGEHEVDPAELGHPFGHDGLEPLEIADVGVFGHDAAPGLLDQVHGLVEILGCRHRVRDAVDLVAQIHRDDVGSLFGEPNRVCASLTPRRAGDEGDFPVELLSHDA